MIKSKMTSKVERSAASTSSSSGTIKTSTTSRVTKRKSPATVDNNDVEEPSSVQTILKDEDEGKSFIPPKKNRSSDIMMSLLECPVCTELPRGGPIFGCRNGHLMCQVCIDKVVECPVCREKDIKCRSIFAEQIMETAFKDVSFKCKFNGCLKRLPLKELDMHEKLCPQREVPCPSYIRKACDWKGPLSGLILHMKEKKCVQVIFDLSLRRGAAAASNVDTENEEEPSVPKFRSNLGDFPSEAPSVFNRPNVVTHWKPVVLLSKSILNVWCYVLVQRSSPGDWTFLTYSMLPKGYAEKIKVRIAVGEDAEESGRKFVYEGHLLSFETSREEAIKSGNFMLLNDAQIKPFKKANQNTIFNYSVEIIASKEDMENLNNDFRPHHSNNNCKIKVEQSTECESTVD